MSFYWQSGASHQRDGYVKSTHVEGHGGAVLQSQRRANRVVWHSLRKCDGHSRLGDSALGGPRVTVRIIKKRTPHAVMLRHFSESRIFIGISLSDGISTSLLEAMATGCYPIQTSTSCASEWLTSTSGAVVGLSDIGKIGQHIREAITSDALVDEAATANIATIQSRASTQVVSSIALGFCQNLLS